jgi:hypothetical protein
MKNWSSLALIITISFAGCAPPPPSDDETLRHVETIDACFTPIYLRQMGVVFQRAMAAAQAGRTPAPTPTLDEHDVRLCYIAKVNDRKIDRTAKDNAKMIAIGRACEDRINTASDYAMGEYALCVNGRLSAMRKAAHPRPHS